MIVYIVRRLYWEYQDLFYGLIDEGPVKAFIDSKDAKRYAREQDAQERAKWKKLDATLPDRTPIHEQSFYEVISMELEQ